MLDRIENIISPLMDRSAGSLPSKVPDSTYPPVVEKILAIIERFVGKYGSVQFEIFRLPSLQSELVSVTNWLKLTAPS